MASEVISAWEKLGVSVCSVCHFKTSDRGTFQCHTCIRKKSQISINFNNHNQKYSCSVCKVSQSRHEFKEHLQCHLIEKPFKCKFCDNEFESKLNNATHFRQMHPFMECSYELKVRTDTDKLLDIARSKGQHFITPYRKDIPLECTESVLGTDDISKQNLNSTEAPYKQLLENTNFPGTQHGRGRLDSGEALCSSENKGIQTIIAQSELQLPNASTADVEPQVNVNQDATFAIQPPNQPIHKLHIISPLDQYSISAISAHAKKKPPQHPKNKSNKYIKNSLPKLHEGNWKVDKCNNNTIPSVSPCSSQIIKEHMYPSRAEYLQQSHASIKPSPVSNNPFEKPSPSKTISLVPSNVVPGLSEVTTPTPPPSPPHPPLLPHAVMTSQAFNFANSSHVTEKILSSHYRDSVPLEVINRDCDSQTSTSIENSTEVDDYSYLNIFCSNKEIVHVCTSCKLRFKERDPFIHHIWKKHAHNLVTTSCSSNFDVTCSHLQRIMKILSDKAKGLFNTDFEKNPTHSSFEENVNIKVEKGLSDSIDPLYKEAYPAVISGDPLCITQLRIKVENQEEKEESSITGSISSSEIQNQMSLDAFRKGPISIYPVDEEEGNRLSTSNMAHDNIATKEYLKTNTGCITERLPEAKMLRGDRMTESSENHPHQNLDSDMATDTSNGFGSTEQYQEERQNNEKENAGSALSNHILENAQDDLKGDNSKEDLTFVDTEKLPIDGNLTSGDANSVVEAGVHQSAQQGSNAKKIIVSSADQILEDSTMRAQHNLLNKRTIAFPETSANIEGYENEKLTNCQSNCTLTVKTIGGTIASEGNVKNDVCNLLAREVERQDNLSYDMATEYQGNNLQPDDSKIDPKNDSHVEAQESLSEKSLIKSDLNISDGISTSCNFYKCSFNDCDYSSCRPVDFLSHTQDAHGMEATYLCFYCGFEGQSTAALLDHLQRHLGDSSDSYSGSIWTDSEVLLTVEHKIMNTLICILESKDVNEHNVNFSCNMCECKFSTLQTLKKHLESSTLKTYSCNHCRSNFLDSKSAEKHYRNEHPGKPRFRRQYVKLLCKDRVLYKETFSKLVKTKNESNVSRRGDNLKESDEGKQTAHTGGTPECPKSLKYYSQKALQPESSAIQISSPIDNPCEKSLNCAEILSERANVEERLENRLSPETVHKIAEDSGVPRLNRHSSEQLSLQQKTSTAANISASDTRKPQHDVGHPLCEVEDAGLKVSESSLLHMMTSSLGNNEMKSTPKEIKENSLQQLNSKYAPRQMKRIYDLCAEERTAQYLSTLYSNKADGFFSCNQCGESKRRLKRMLCHIFFCQGKTSVVDCLDCSFGSEHTSFLLKHIKEFHPNKGSLKNCGKVFRYVNIGIFFSLLKDKEITQEVFEKACHSDQKRRIVRTTFRKTHRKGTFQSIHQDHVNVSPLSVKHCLNRKKCSQNGRKKKKDIIMEDQRRSIVKISTKTKESSESNQEESRKDILASNETLLSIPGCQHQQKFPKLSNKGNDPFEKEHQINLNGQLKKLLEQDNISVQWPRPSDSNTKDIPPEMPSFEENKKIPQKGQSCPGGKSSQEHQSSVTVPKSSVTVPKSSVSVPKSSVTVPKLSVTLPKSSVTVPISLSFRADLPGPSQQSPQTEQSLDYCQILYNADRSNCIEKGFDKGNHKETEVIEENHVMEREEREEDPCESVQAEEDVESSRMREVRENFDNQQLKSDKFVTVRKKSESADMPLLFDKNIYKCKICSSEFNFDIDRMKGHVNEEHRFFICGYCDSPYHNLKFLRSHIRFAHENSKVKFHQIPLEMMFTRINSKVENNNFRMETLKNTNVKPIVAERERDENCDQTVNISTLSSILKANNLNCQNVNAMYFESLEGNIVKETDIEKHSVSPSPSESNGLKRPIESKIRPQSNADEDSLTCAHFKENLDEILCEGQTDAARLCPFQKKVVSVESILSHDDSVGHIATKRQAKEVLLHRPQKYKKFIFNDLSEETDFSSSDQTYSTSMHENVNHSFEKGSLNPMSSESQQHKLSGGSKKSSTLRPLSFQHLYGKGNGKALTFKLFGGLFICRSCNSSFSSISEVKCHVTSEHTDSDAGWIEQRTGSTYLSTGQKLYDMTSEHPYVTRYLCGYCVFQTKSKPFMSRHMVSAHSSMEYHYALPLCEDGAVAYTEKCSARSEGESNFGCPHEAFITAKSNFLQYQCHLCSMCLPSEFLFRHHLAKHEGFKHCSTLSNTTGLLLCAICGYLAMSSAELANHTNRHMTERRFSCSICGFDDHHRKGVQVHISKSHNAASSACIIDNSKQNKDVDIRPRLVNLLPDVLLEDIHC